MKEFIKVFVILCESSTRYTGILGSVVPKKLGTTLLQPRTLPSYPRTTVLSRNDLLMHELDLGGSILP